MSRVRAYHARVRLACRNCGKEYVLTADQQARGVYQIRCIHCGSLVGAEAPRLAAPTRPPPVAARPEARAGARPAAPMARPAAPPPPPRADEYIDLVLDETPAPSAAGGALQARGPAPAPPMVVEVPVTPAPRAGAREREISEAVLEEAPAAKAAPPRRSRSAYVVGGAAAVVAATAVAVGLGVGGGGEAPSGRGERSRSVISTSAPPLAPADPEVAAAEAREEQRRAEAALAAEQDAVPAAPATPARHRTVAPRAAAHLAPVGVTPAPAAAPALTTPPAFGLAPAPAAPAPPAAPGREVEEIPSYAGAGFRSPAPARPRCLQESIRIPHALQGRLSGSITVKFAVGRDGSVGLFEILGEQPDPRVAEALESAVRSCEFRPGADAQGRATRLWVVMPLRFVP